MTAKMRHVAGGVIFIETDIDVRRQKYKRGSFSLPINCRKKTRKGCDPIFFPAQFEWVANHTMETVAARQKKTKHTLTAR